MKSTLIAAVMAVAGLSATEAKAQVYYYPSTGGYYYSQPSTSYYPGTGVIQTGNVVVSPAEGTVYFGRGNWNNGYYYGNRYYNNGYSNAWYGNGYNYGGSRYYGRGWRR